MLEDAPTAGSISSSASTRRELAAKSHIFNANAPLFRRLFPQLVNVAKGEEMLARYRQTEQQNTLLILAGLIAVLMAAILYRVLWTS